MRFFLLQVFRLGKHLFITLEQLSYHCTDSCISDMKLFKSNEMFIVDIANLNTCNKLMDYIVQPVLITSALYTGILGQFSCFLRGHEFLNCAAS